MKLEIQRKWFTDNTTIGMLFVNGKFFCYTLEDTFREGDIFKVKVNGKTAIPSGEYKVIISVSPRFKRLMPHILNVQNFDGILIHAGNTSNDTEGCVLVGRTRAIDFVGDSVNTFNKFFRLINELPKDEPITLTIVNEKQ